MTPTITLIISLSIPFLLGLGLVPLVRAIARRQGWVDNPDGTRKLHESPTPNVGGVAITASALIGLVAISWVTNLLAGIPVNQIVIVILGGMMVLGMGFYDDLYHLGFKRKFVIQIAVSYIILHAGYRIEVANLPFMSDDPYTQALFSIPVTMLWVVGLLNAINLLDGIDGLAAGVSMIAFLGFAAIFGAQGNMAMAGGALMMVGALAAFLVFNFNPASIFMGDSGSLVLGYGLSLCSLALGDSAHPNTIIALIIPVIIIALPLYDTSLCVVRRVRNGGSPFLPDRNHIHHRLSRMFSVKKAVMILYGIAIWFGIVAVLITHFDALPSVVILAVTMVAVVLGERLLSSKELLRKGSGKITPSGDGSPHIPQLHVKGFDEEIASKTP